MAALATEKIAFVETEWMSLAGIGWIPFVETGQEDVQLLGKTQDGQNSVSSACLLCIS